MQFILNAFDRALASSGDDIHEAKMAVSVGYLAEIGPLVPAFGENPGIWQSDRYYIFIILTFHKPPL